MECKVCGRHTENENANFCENCRTHSKELSELSKVTHIISGIPMPTMIAIILIIVAILIIMDMVAPIVTKQKLTIEKNS